MEKIKFKRNVLNTIIVPEEFTLKDYIVEAIYVEKDVANAPCFGGHRCNRARFNITINDVIVLDANLNNDEPGAPPALMADGIGSSNLDRYAVTVIPETIALSIKAKNKPDFTLKIVPHPTNRDPHENIVWLRMKNPLGKIVYSTCFAVGSSSNITEAILVDSSVSCLDKVLLEYRMSELELNEDYSVEYDIIDIQHLNTITQNEAQYNFLPPCSSTPVANEKSNGFDIKAKAVTIDSRTTLSMKSVQSALVQIKLLKDGVVISKDIAQVLCDYCNSTETNNLFRVDFENLSMLGTVETLSFPNTVEQPILIKNSSYIDAPISLLCSELTLNRLYEYKFYFIPTIPTLDIKPSSGKFFAGSLKQKVTSIFTITANQIIILYATLKDMETGLVKTTRPMYLYNSDNCNQILKDFHYSEVAALPEPCNLEPCVF